LQLGTTNGAALAFYRRRGYAARDGYKLLVKELAAAAVERAGT
jgi:hypothetical protein